MSLNTVSNRKQKILINGKIENTILYNLQQAGDGVESPYSKGAEAMHRKVHGFFYALTVMVGGVRGSRKACRTLCPVSQPLISSAALSLRAPAGGLQPQQRSSIMNNPNKTAPVCAPQRQKMLRHAGTVRNRKRTHCLLHLTVLAFNSFGGAL